MKRVRIAAVAVFCLFAPSLSASAATGGISHNVLGTWTRRDENGHLLRMQFLPNGTLRDHYFNYGSKTMEDRVEHWTVERSNLIMGGMAVDVRFSGRKMTIISQPASATMIDHWTRAK